MFSFYPKQPTGPLFFCIRISTNCTKFTLCIPKKMYGFPHAFSRKPLRRSIKHRTNENHHFSEYLSAVYIQALTVAFSLLPSSKLNAHPAGPVKLV